ncbi:hypothetical protein EYF80_013307 [Liparis tanakae]|uniref:Uncharacterized protein n=1 Tax=Liparis tanakae TaxID=230148 RepID=A0A4Z2IGK9_9TELE|nr:hypothetical protein EYF80_013307 [Liparis tanakae]
MQHSSNKVPECALLRDPGSVFRAFSGRTESQEVCQRKSIPPQREDVPHNETSFLRAAFWWKACPRSAALDTMITRSTSADLCEVIWVNVRGSLAVYRSGPASLCLSWCLALFQCLLPACWASIE